VIALYAGIVEGCTLEGASMPGSRDERVSSRSDARGLVEERRWCSER